MMNEVHCTCSCGKASFVVTGPILCRVRCHCTICQSVNQAPFADSTILMAKHVPLDRVEHVRFETLKEPPALQRGFCRSCGCFVMAHGTILPFLTLAFVPAARYPPEVQLPELAMHVYYETRIADVDDDLPKYETTASLLTVLRVLLRAKMRRLGRA
jgi:hypothetical protein